MRRGHRVPIKYPLQWFFYKPGAGFDNFFHWVPMQEIGAESENLMKNAMKKKVFISNNAASKTSNLLILV